MVVVSGLSTTISYAAGSLCCSDDTCCWGNLVFVHCQSLYLDGFSRALTRTPYMNNLLVQTLCTDTDLEENYEEDIVGWTKQFSLEPARKLLARTTKSSDEYAVHWKQFLVKRSAKRPDLKKCIEGKSKSDVDILFLRYSKVVKTGRICKE
jgi:hypothetical protein